MPLGTEIGLGPGHIVLDGDPAPPSQKRGGQQRPTLRPMYCGQTPRWINMPLGTEIGLGPGHIVLDGDPGPPLPKWGTAPNFRPLSLVVKRLD